MKIAIIVIVVIVVIGGIVLWLASGSGSKQNYTVRTLGSGKQVKTISVTPVKFSDGSTSLMLKYQTDLKISDSEALKKEVNEIWQEFKIEVERNNMKDAIVSANEAPRGFIAKQNKSYNFVFRKSTDGSWSMMGK